MLFTCRIKPESDEKSVSTGKLFQMLTTRSVKNEERGVQLFTCLRIYEFAFLFPGVDPGFAKGGCFIV